MGGHRGQECDPVWTRPCKDGIRPDTPPKWFKGSWTEAEHETVRTFTQSMIIRA